MIEPDDTLARERSNNKNTTSTVASKNRRHSAFEWIQLIATICIPVIIAIYTIIDNNKKESIAAADRRKDVDIANSSRMAELEIAKANRLHEMIIAEENRQKDRDLALDQQRENILAQYQTFMADLLIKNGMTLNETPTAKPVAISMTLTTLSQLDPRRKGIVIRSLYQSKLLTLQTDSNPFIHTSILPLHFPDLSHITFGSPRSSAAELTRGLFVDWYYIWLRHSILTNASFRHAALSCATLSDAYMELVDMSFVMSPTYKCFNDTAVEGQMSFADSRLMNASFYKAQFRFTSFDFANLTFANMRELYCIQCTFRSAILFQADLSFASFFVGFPFDSRRLTFDSSDLRQVVMHSANFRSVSFSQSDWSNVRATQIKLFNCSFISAKMDHCSLTKSYIDISLFQNASLFSVDFSYTTLYTVSFIDTDMRNANMSSIQCNYCNFTNVTLQGAIWNNASLRYSTFRNCHIDQSQLEQIIDLSGSTLPNGTVIKSNQ